VRAGLARTSSLGRPSMGQMRIPSSKWLPLISVAQKEHWSTCSGGENVAARGDIYT
jgi:hypothetical protein